MRRLHTGAARILAAGGIAILQTLLAGNLQAADAGTAQPLVHSCKNVASGAKHDKYGCFNIGRASGLSFDLKQPVFWHLYMFPDEKAAQAAKSRTGIVVKEYGRVWLSEFGPPKLRVTGGQAMATVGPMPVTRDAVYSAVFSYVVMRPGDRTPVQTHPGPEAWYVLAGQQCLETPQGVGRAHPGDAMVLQQNVPMQLVAKGKTDRHAFAVVLHEASERSIPSNWRPTGACTR